MFDIGFSELLIIGLVALVVIGPERLPRVARTLGHLFGRMQRYVNDVKADINREVQMDELRKIQSSVEGAARDLEHSVTTEIRKAESDLQRTESDLRQSVEGAGEAAPEPSPAALEPPSQAPAAPAEPAAPAARQA